MKNEVRRVFIGYDTKEKEAYEVCWKSLIKHSSVPLLIEPLQERRLRHAGLHTRQWTMDSQGQFIDKGDQKPFSTEFSFTRFLVPTLCQWKGAALYCDSDFLWREDVERLFEEFLCGISDKAVWVVKHNHAPEEKNKMSGQVQTRYYRKNWSSLILWDNKHPANLVLTPDKVNSMSGQWLHSFGWLEDHEIGELPEEWNWLSGISSPGIEPKAAHFTKGIPLRPECEDSPFADEWLEVLNS